MIGIVILNYNNYKQTIQCIEHIKKLNIEKKIVIVDNNSTNDSFQVLNAEYGYDYIVLQSGENKGYSYGNNYGLKWLANNTNIEYAIVANPDTFFDEKYVNKICNVMDRKEELALVTGQMLNKDKSVVNNQYWLKPRYIDDLANCFLLINKIRKKLFIKEFDYEEVEDGKLIYVVPAGCCEIIRMDAMKKVEYFDENVFLFYEENILAARFHKLGYKTAILDSTNYFHLHSTTIQKYISLVKKHDIYLDSLEYYEIWYNNIDSIRKLILKLAVVYSKVEFRIYRKVLRIIENGTKKND